MTIPMKSVFAVVLAIVAGSIFLVSRDVQAPVASLPQPVQPAAVVTAAAADERPADPASQAMAATAAGAEYMPASDGGLKIPAITSDAERAETLDARKNALPVFLKAADESIAATASELETARVRGAAAEDINALEEKLRTLQRVREQVLARNNDIRG